MFTTRPFINKMHIWTTILIVYLNAQAVFSNEEGPLLTQTIYGFLDFTTTIGNTVMVFSPQSAPSLVLTPEIIAPVINTKSEKVTPLNSLGEAIRPTKLKTENIKSKLQSNSKQGENTILVPNSSSFPTSKSPVSIPQHVASPNDIVHASLAIANDLEGPEYDLLSRQPPQFVEESFRVVNLKSTNKNTRTPVVVTPEKNLASTISLSSKLQSRSHKNKKNKLRPSSTLQVLKTAAPIATQKHGTNNKISQRNSSSSSSLSSSTSRKSSKKGSSHRGTTSTTSTTAQPENVVIVKSTTTRNKPKRKNKHKNSTTSKTRYSTTTSATTTEQTVRRTFRPKLQISNSDLDNNNNLHITKLNRTPGRWQYKTSPKPRVNIRKPALEANGSAGLNNITLPISSTLNVFPEGTLGESINGNFLNQNVIYNQSDLEISGSQNGPILNNIDQEGKHNVFTETINVEISTPVDFKDTYYEIATIKKPFIFQAGVLKKTRFITVTSTIEKYLTPEPSLEQRSDDEPLTENILAPSTKEDGVLMGSITTLAPIYVNGENDTPILETLTESFSIVNKKLKTQILPVINENANDTTYHTLVQTIDLTSLITVTKTTLPQLETKEFNGFKDFVGNLDEAGSEINLDLEFGDEGNQENGSGEANKNDFDTGRLNKTSHVPAFTTGVLNLPSPNVITNSRPVVKLETLWESYVVPITNGQSTTFRTLSKAKGVVEKTDFIIDTTTLSLPPPILPPSTVNPFLLPLPQQFQTITSPIIQQTIVTQTESKVLKLTFGAKTAYTTLYSTQIVPTIHTMYVTTSVPVQPTANPFQGFFPQPYNPFAYLG